MKKVIFLFLLIVLCWGCSSSSTTEKYQSKRENVINVHDRMKGIVIKDVLISNFSCPQIIDDYMFVIDYKTADEYVHIFNKNNFEYITSTVLKGQGPGEIARIGGHIAEDKVNRKFYVPDFGKYKIFSYDLDSVVADPAYLPIEKMKMNEQMVLDKYKYINDTLSIGVIIQRLGNGNFNPVVSKFNMKTGEIVPMSYTINPKVKKKRTFFDLSMGHGIYVEAYLPHDLMTICNIDGDLKYNIYGPNWDTEKPGEDYYKNVRFCKNKIVTTYLGERGTTADRKAIYATKFVIFDLEGNYLKTLETGYPIIGFCYDKDNNRIIMSLNDEKQFAYLDVGDLLN
ncbi:MAG: hypothetical protein PARBB_00510 [Parabacteroides distasonis]